MRHPLRYAAGWIRADLVGLTVCKLIDHRQPTPEELDFAQLLADTFGHSAMSDLRRPICGRCGSLLDTPMRGEAR